MSDDSELRATSDRMLLILDEIRDAELAKRQESPGTETFAKLAYDVMELARTVSRWSELQLRQANEALGRQGPEDNGRVLAEVPARRLDEILAEWRQAEIRLSQAQPGSSDADHAAADAARLRLEYQALQEKKLQHR